MAEFTPITTQAEFDAAIGERLKRERETLSKKYGDYEDLKNKVADYEKQIGQMSKAAKESAEKYAGYDKTLAELQAKVKDYETDSVKTRIAHETGLPYELAGRLTGEDEAAIRKDAEALSKLLGGQPVCNIKVDAKESYRYSVIVPDEKSGGLEAALSVRRSAGIADHKVLVLVAGVMNHLQTKVGDVSAHLAPGNVVVCDGHNGMLQIGQVMEDDLAVFTKHLPDIVHQRNIPFQNWVDFHN